MKNANGFVLAKVGGKSCPRIACEKCGQLIDDYQQAGVVWKRDSEEEGSRVSVTVLCKTNKCLTTEPYAHLPWQELRDYLLWVVYNTGMKTEQQLREAWKSSNFMDGF